MAARGKTGGRKKARDIEVQTSSWKINEYSVGNILNGKCKTRRKKVSVKR